MLPLLASISLAQASFAEKADVYMNAYAKPGHFSGAVLVAIDGKPVFRKAYGYADWSTKRPMTLDTPVMLFSITKSFTATAVLMLRDKGLIDLQSRVSKYLSPWPKEWSEVTIHHLLTHTAGLNSESALRWLSNPNAPVEAPKTTPGTKYDYSNLGYLILARVVAKVSGVPFPEFVQKHIFDRLEMSHSGEGGFRDGAKRVARGHELAGARYVPFDQTTSDMVGAADLHSTVDDMLKWRLALERSTLVSEESRKAMFTPWVSTGGQMAYGYGWAIDKGRGMIGHSGSGASASTSIQSFAKGHVIVIVLRNSDSEVDPMPTEGLASLALGKPAKAPRFVDLGEADVLQGAYGKPGDMSFVTMADGEFQIEWPTGLVKPLVPIRPWRYRAGDIAVQFIASRSGWILRSEIGGKQYSNPLFEIPIARLDAMAGSYGDFPQLVIRREGRRLLANLLGQEIEFFPTGPDRFRAIDRDAQLSFVREKGKVKLVRFVSKGRNVEFPRN